MPLKVYESGDAAKQSKVDAINYLVAKAIADPARRYIGNCSWFSAPPIPGDAMEMALDNAYSHNVPMVFAAGNSGGDAMYPSYRPAPNGSNKHIAVAASTVSDQFVQQGVPYCTGYNCGDPSWSTATEHIDVSAPGHWMMTTGPFTGSTSPSCEASTLYDAYFDGTSAAAPAVSGVVGLMLTVDKTLTNTYPSFEIRSILTATADGTIKRVNSNDAVLGARCERNADCDDHAACSGADSCVNGLCQLGPLCHDGRKCDGDEACSEAGTCTAGTPVQCAAGKVCVEPDPAPPSGPPLCLWGCENTTCGPDCQPSEECELVGTGDIECLDVTTLSTNACPSGQAWYKYVCECEPLFLSAVPLCPAEATTWICQPY